MNATKSNESIETRIERIARLQREAAEALEAAARRNQQLMIEIDAEAKEVVHALRGDRKGAVAAKVAEACAHHAVDVGDLRSDFSETCRARGHDIYPTPYRANTAKWAIVEAR